MSDYDAAFAAATGVRPDDPYDALMKGLTSQFKPVEAPSNAPASVQAGAAISNNISSIPRQLGLTARYGLEGLANTAQIVTEPARYLLDKVTPDRAPTLSGLITGERPPKSMPLGAVASQFADWVGLPKPEGANERVIGDATRLMAGAGGMGAAARAAQALPGMARKAAEFLGANMGAQVSSAAGAGLTGGASREAGASPLVQGGAALLGGVAGGLAPSAAGLVIDAGNAVKRSVLGGMKPQEMDVQINAILERAGVDYSQVPERARQALRAEMAGALQAGREMDPAAVARLADFVRTNTTPTRGMVSQNPVQITREMNLAKIGANTGDDALHGLPLIQNQNNARLIQNLNEAGAGRGNAFAAGESAIGGINSRDASMQANVRDLYGTARNMAGGDIPLDRKPFIDGIFGGLAQENKLAFLPEPIGKMLNNISAGQITANGQTFDVPFNAQTIDNLKTMIATASRGTQDGNVRAALSIARNAIEGTGITPLKNTMGGSQLVTPGMAQAMRSADGAPADFMGGLNQARAAAAERFGWRESARPIDAALHGAQPDKFVQQFVIGGTLADARAVAQNAPVDQVKNAIMAHLKEKALGQGASDEVGKFSQSAFNKALDQIGERKLALFFSPEEISNLRANARVASYMQVQPVGSAVNNSNSGALMIGKGMDALAGLANSFPGVGPLITQPITNGLRSLNVTMRTNQAQNIAPGLLARQQQEQANGLLLPALAYGGLLAAP